MPSQLEGRLARGLRVSCPHLVLIAVYLFYLGIGGGIFLAIEGGNQQDYTFEVAKYESLKAQIAEAVRNITDGMEVTARNLTGLWDEYTSLVDDPYLADLTYLSRVDWTFTGSMLFCATSISTIGYGDAVPVTSLGRFVIVIYSLVGIPLTLTFLADIGSLLARVVVFISCKFQCRRGANKRPHTKTQAEGKVKTPHQNGLSTRSAEGTTHEPRGSIVEMRLALGVFQESAETIRDCQPNSRRSSMDAEAQTPIAGIFPGKRNVGFAPDDMSCDEEKKSPNGPTGTGQAVGQATGDTTDTTPQSHVPVIVVVAILLVYTFLGALMIAYVEDWYYGEAIYFTFVTLTTIGFGDFVPVKHYMDISAFFGCLVYTIVGLSVMSMCIALVQTKVVNLMSRVAGKIGF